MGGFRFEGNMTGRLRNGFTWVMDGKHRSYARPTESNDFYLNEIESLMSVEPQFPLKTRQPANREEGFY